MLNFTPLIKLLAPVGILIAGFSGARWLQESAPRLEQQQPEESLPLVKAVSVQIKPHNLEVYTHGEVLPSNTVQIAAEVSAKVIWTSPDWQKGAFFSEGEILLKLDPVDYRLALSSAQAKIAQAEAALALEEAEAQSSLQDWQELGEGEAPDLVAHKPQLAMARANLSAAKAGVQQAQRAVDRCEISAPVNGRVMQVNAEKGQFVGPGAVVGMIYGTRKAEVSLALQLQDLAWLELGLGELAKPVEVEFEALLGQELQTWSGLIVRTEASLNARNRMIVAIAEIVDPYALKKSPQHSALSPGMFLNATVKGKVSPSVATLPRAVLREDGTVLVIDSNNKIRIQAVEILKKDSLEIHISNGLQNGDQVCLTPLPIVMDGMQVRVLEAGSGENQ